MEHTRLELMVTMRALQMHGTHQARVDDVLTQIMCCINSLLAITHALLNTHHNIPRAVGQIPPCPLSPLSPLPPLPFLPLGKVTNGLLTFIVKHGDLWKHPAHGLPVVRGVTERIVTHPQHLHTYTNTYYRDL